MESPARTRSASRGDIPEDVLISVLQGHFSPSHPTGSTVTVPTLQGKLRHGAEVICSWSQVQTAGGEEWQTGFLGAVGSMESRAQTWGSQFPVITKPLDADGRGAQEKHPRLVALVVPQERTFLTIMLSDFLAFYN